MEYRSLFANTRFSRALWIVCAICAAILLNSIFIIGGPATFQVTTTLISPVAALAASILFFRARFVVKDPNFQHLWLWMGIGFGLWAIAEIVWALYALVITNEIPTLSFADLLWIVGYIPLYLALAIRQRTLQSGMTTVQKWLVVIVSLVSLVVTVTIGILPILNNWDPERLLEGLVFLCYPVGDLGLVVLSLISLILIKGGRYSLSWRLIFTGIFVMALSDILYNYAIWNELYYPESQVNFLSSFIDTSYALSYVLVGFGAYVYGVLWEIKEVPEMTISTMPSKRYHAFVGTNRENQIISFSENFPWLLNAKSDYPFYKMPLSEACGIDNQIVHTLMNKIIDRGSLYLEPVTIITLDRKARAVFLSALATFDTEQEFTGVNIVLRSDIAVPAELQLPKSRDLQAITRSILATTSVQLKKEDQVLRTYFLKSFQILISILFQFGGGQHHDEILAGLNRGLRQKNLDAEISDQVIAISEDYEGEELAGILSDLLLTTKNLVSRIVGAQVVKEKMVEFEQQMSLSMAASQDRLKINAAQSG